MSEAEPDIDDVDAGLREAPGADRATLRHARRVAAARPNNPDRHDRSATRIARPVAPAPRAGREDEARPAA